MSIVSKFRTAYKLIKFRVQEKTYQKRLKYLFFDKKSDTLLICFSAFPPGNIRLYNNVKGFENLNVDRLYINDTFGYKGSYYLYENGSKEPFELTCGLLRKYLGGGKYTKVYMAGTSKGGSCAIMFGLLFNADKVFSGACQYHIGTYLNTPDHYPIFESMMGKGASKNEEAILNGEMPAIIEKSSGTKTTIHLLYSKQEHTYEEDIKDLLDDLKKNNISVVEKEEYFTEHGDVGYYFIPFVKSIIGN